MEVDVHLLLGGMLSLFLTLLIFLVGPSTIHFVARQLFGTYPEIPTDRGMASLSRQVMRHVLSSEKKGTASGKTSRMMSD